MTIEKGAAVRDSIVFSYSRIGRGARVTRSIVDKFVVIGNEATVGGGERGRAAPGARHAKRPGDETGGIAVLGRGARVSRERARACGDARRAVFVHRRAEVTLSRTVVFILAGGVGKRLSLLTRYRAKPAVSFGGKYRIIDFTLTNCIRSGIDEAYILTQYISRSLVRHIGIGKPWDMDRMTGGLHVLHPHLGYQAADWYRGTADAIFQNISVLKRLDCEDVLILSGDHVYLMDYRDFIAFHRREREAGIGRGGRRAEGDDERIRHRNGR